MCYLACRTVLHATDLRSRHAVPIRLMLGRHAHSCPPVVSLATPGHPLRLVPMSNRPLACVVSVSGIRGLVGKTIDVDQVLALGAAYGQTIAKGGKVILARDSRPTGALFAQAVSAGLRSV